MKTTSKRLFSFLMALCMLLSLAPMTALAMDDTVTVKGTEYYSLAYDVLDIVNDERAKEGLSPLTMTEDLLNTAMLRSREQSVYYSHTRPDGSNCFTAFPGEPYGVGENIAANHRNPTRVMEDWMASSGHRKNIMNSTYTTVGIGCFEHNGVKYWTQCFSKASGTAYKEPADREITADVNIGTQVYNFTLGGTTEMKAGTSQTLTIRQSNPGFNWAKTHLEASGLEWSSSDPAVASVSEGVVTANSAGTAVIRTATGVTELTFTVNVSGDAQHTHTMVHVEAKEPTYKESGLMEHWMCSVCEKCFTDENAVAEIDSADVIIEKLQCTDHEWDSGRITTAPTATTPGVKTFSCTKCGTEKTEALPPNDSITMMHSGDLNTPKPTQAQLSSMWNTISAATEFYTEAPSVSAPYKAGALTKSFLTSGLSYLNFLRYAAGLPSVQLSDDLNTDAQYGAVLLAATDRLSHTPAKPGDMDEDFYKKGYAATSSSNISMRSGYTNYNPLQSSLQGCINDSGTNNLATLGHRRWLLNPTLLNVGFGVASSKSGADYIATKVFDRSGSGIDYDFISWPASGSFPVDVFTSDVPWSITLNPQNYKTPSAEDLTITLTRVEDNKVWTFDGSTGGPTTNASPFLTVNTGGYGIGNCIIFSPGASNISEYYGTYTVTVSGLELQNGNSTTLHYQVDFFTLNGCIHSPSTTAAVAPTCETDGKTEGSVCSKCGTVLTAAEIIPATGHKEITLEGTPATCEADGTTDSITCKTCEKVLQKQEPIPALGHKYESTVTTPANCEAEGVMTYVCKNDETHTYTESIPKTEHTDEDGNGHCDACDFLMCTDHKPAPVAGKDATCTEEGLTEGSKCSICGETLTEQKPIPPLDHDEIPDDEILPTCTEDGISEGSHCDRCGYVFNKQEILPAKGHTPVELPEQQSTCTETGLGKGSKCSECGEILTKQEVIPAKDHTELVLEGKQPTCTEQGLSEGSKCSECGEILTKQEVLPVVPHSFKDGKCSSCGLADPAVTPTPTPTPVVTPTPTPVVTPTPTPEVTPTPTPEVTPTPTPEVTPTPTPEVTPTPTPEVTPTPTPEVTPTPTPAVTPTPTPVVTPTPTPEVTPTPTPEVTPTPTPEVTPEPTPEVTPTPTPTPVPGDNPFTDVRQSDYFYAPVLWAVEKGITGGIGGGMFGPDQPCTRGQVVMFLWRANGSPEPNSTVNYFTDITVNDYFYKAVLWAVEKGITGGIGNGMFGPDQPCTRAQVATFLWRAKGSPEGTMTLNPFIDVVPEDYYFKSVLWAVEQGITGGIGYGMFGPDNTCTRGQIATFLYKAYQ